MITIKFILLFILTGVSAYFSGIETAITSLSTFSLRNLKEKYPKSKIYFEFWEKRPNELISTILVCNNLAIIGTSVIATSLALDFVEVFDAPKHYALLLFPVAVTLFLLFFGEIIPKITARYRSDRVAVWGLPMLVRVNNALNPLNRLLIRISERLIGIFGRRYVTEDPFLSPEELRFLLSSKDTLPLPDTQRAMMKNILEFGKKRINQVMVPRTEIQAVDLAQDTKLVIEQIIDKEYSRVPVYRGSMDNIVGIVYSRDLALAWRNGSLFLIEDLIRPVTFVPDSAHVDRVLRDFKTSHNHMALVVNEFGSTVGLVTIEDLVEELVGEVWDEYDIQEKRIISLPDGSHLLKGTESLAYINHELKLTLPANDFATVNGWVLDLFGKIPKAGDTVRWDDLSIEIVDADKKKVLRVRIKKLT